MIEKLAYAVAVLLGVAGLVLVLWPLAPDGNIVTVPLGIGCLVLAFFAWRAVERGDAMRVVLVTVATD